MTDQPLNFNLSPARRTAAREQARLAIVEAQAASIQQTTVKSVHRSAWWIYGFTIFEIVCQLLLLFPQTAVLRVPLRVSAFGVSLAYLVLLPPLPGVRWHPAAGCLIASILLLCLSLVNPQGGTTIAGLATILQYAAIAAPIVWAGGLRLTLADFHRLLIILFAFAALSAFVGTLQTLRPDWTFLQPNLSSVVQNFNDGGEGMKVSLADGSLVFRPMGLSDMPGGAATAGMATILFGLALLTKTRRPGAWCLIVPAMVLGLYCIYLSQVRSILVMCGVCVIAMTFCMTLAGQFARISAPLAALAAVIAIGTPLALFVGGATVSDRFSTLVADDPTTVYLENRGFFLQDTIFNAIPKYPLGAGLGRWGMISYYFGSDSGEETLWAEIMWTAWAYDGGVPLIACYSAAILIAIWQMWMLSNDPTSPDARLFAATVFAFNIGGLALTFNYPFYMSQGGMDCWLLNAVLFVAVSRHRAARSSATAMAATQQAAREAAVPVPTSLLGMHS